MSLFDRFRSAGRPQPRIRYLLEPFDEPFGGVAVVHRHVEWLAAEGYDAAISLARPPPRDFYGSTAPMDIHGGRPTPQPGDRYVVPEGLPQLLKMVAGAPIRRIMFCQNQYYVPFGSDPRAGIAEIGVDRIVGSSEAVHDFFRDVPVVPGLAGISRKEIDRRRESAGIPKFALDAALALPSSNGKSYGERLDAVKTELQLSEIYEDFIAQVPFGKRFLADRNPVRTGGPMQVSVSFAEAFATARPYPYPITGNIRHEVFTRRGGVWFGTAHLLAYPANYDRMLYRFADYNTGQYSSRNAGFQSAVTQVSGVSLDLDGDLLRYDHGEPAAEVGSTELATRALARRINLTDAEIRHDLALGKEPAFADTRVYRRVFELADRVNGAPVPRAVVPQIPLHSPKITRNLTSDWFADRVDRRYRTCLGRMHS